MMKQPVLIGVAAILVGLFGAACVLVFLKPQDRPLQMPGVEHAQETTLTGEPPVILKLGSPMATQFVHLALGDDLEADKRAYHATRTALDAAQNVGLNVLPAMGETSPLHEAYAWALSAPADGREAFIDGLMGTSGDITPQVLSLLAQNSGLDEAALKTRAQSSEVEQSMRQGRSVLPPSLPALYVNGSWLPDVTPTAIQDALRVAQNQTADVSGARVVVSNAYAFATAPTATTAAVFLSLRNAGDSEAAITAAATPVAERVELHGHMMEGDVMKMRPVETIAIKKGETVELNPHGFHIMLFDLPAPLAVGQSFPMTLRLQDGTEIIIRVEVVPPGTAPAPDAGAEPTSDPALTHEGHSG